MPPKRRRIIQTRLTGATANDTKPPGIASDAWAPYDIEVGSTLSQVLHRPSRRRSEVKSKSRIATISKTPKLQKTRKTNRIIETATKKADDASPKAHIRSRSSSLENISNILERKHNEIGQQVDYSNEALTVETDSGDLEAAVNVINDSNNEEMEFMDEESARNYQRLIESSNSRKAITLNRSKSKPQALDLDKSLEPKSSELHITENVTPTTTPTMRRTLHRRQLSDSEDESDDGIDTNRIIDSRLRSNESKQTPTRSRFEQARINAHCLSYDTDSGSEADDIGEFCSSAEVTQLPISEIDEPEPQKKNVALVVDDSSENEDMILDPSQDEIPIARKPEIRRKRPVRKVKQSKIENFVSMFSRAKALRTHDVLEDDTSESEVDDELDDFIVDDDDPDEVESALAMLPQQFEKSDLRMAFKTYVQYLVYWILNNKRRFNCSSTDIRYFSSAHTMLSNIIGSLEQSMVVSSAWVPKFRADLNKFPEVHSAKIFPSIGCDACYFNSNRTATFNVTFSGDPYDPDMLVPRSSEDGDISSDLDVEMSPASKAHNSRKPYKSYNRATNSISSDNERNDSNPSPEEEPFDNDNNSILSDDELRDLGNNVEYKLGKFCMRRALTCHHLHHYLYHLASAIEVEISILEISQDKLDDIDPETVVAQLDKESTIDRRFNEFKELVSNAKSGFASGEAH